jgi:hypothetical protein
VTMNGCRSHVWNTAETGGGIWGQTNQGADVARPDRSGSGNEFAGWSTKRRTYTVDL